LKLDDVIDLINWNRLVCCEW